MFSSRTLGIIKNSGGNFPAAVSRETSVTIKFAGHELSPALALGLADDDAVIIIAHELLDIQERLSEGGGDGLKLAQVGKDGQYGLFGAFAVKVGVQAKGVNMGLLAVLEVLHVPARQAGEAVHSFLVFGEVCNVSFDDGHGIFSFKYIWCALAPTQAAALVGGLN